MFLSSVVPIFAWCDPPFCYLSLSTSGLTVEVVLLEKKKKKVSDWVPSNEKIDRLGIFIFCLDGKRDWRQNEWKLYHEMQCETRPSGI